MQSQMGRPPLKLIMDIETRWNSTYFMIKLICELQEPLKATLGVLNNQDLALEDSEWETLKGHGGNEYRKVHLTFKGDFGCKRAMHVVEIKF